ncbi:RagB/SusD family nutrient uptake outer membrane protein [Flavitalea flava]
MNYRKILTIVLAGYSLTGCHKFLDIAPQTSLTSETFFKTQADFQQAVNATYNPLREIYNNQIFYTTEMHSDNAYYYRNPQFGATEQQENLADFAITVSNNLMTNRHVTQQYRDYYVIISRCNQILATIDAIDFDASVKDNLKGQTLYMRAFSYFALERYFGSVPLHLTPVLTRQQAALPLSTADSVLLQVESDALAASKLLPNKAAQEPGRATSGAAKTLLADSYMEHKKWSDAEPVLKDVVTSGDYSLIPEYNNVFSGTTDNKNNAESVFEIQFMEGSDGLNGSLIYNMLPMPLSSTEIEPIVQVSNPQDLSGEGNNAPTPDLIAAYEVGDKRKDATIGYVFAGGSANTNKTYPYCLKYAKPHAIWNNTGNNVPAYRYSEVLLMLAEVLNEGGKGSEAIPYIDKVRTRAGLGGTTATAQADLRAAILQERRVELAFECKRWFDLVRSNSFSTVITDYGNRIKTNPQAYYYPPGAVPPNNAFSVITARYPLPADEGSLSPYF